jgi:hypothetical protein
VPFDSTRSSDVPAEDKAISQEETNASSRAVQLIHPHSL